VVVGPPTEVRTSLGPEGPEVAWDAPDGATASTSTASELRLAPDTPRNTTRATARTISPPIQRIRAGRSMGA